jgi:hypothetical protein
VPLYLGIPLTILILAVASSIRIGRFTFEWVAAAAAALWAVHQSRKYQLQRFERVFPLEPLPLGVTVLFLFPVTFPWFLRLRYKALRGRLPLRKGPSKLRLVLIGVVIVGGLALNIGFGVLRRTEPWKKLETSMSDLQAAAGGSVNYQVRDRVLVLTIENEKLYRAAPLVQRDTAEVIARKAMAALTSSFGLLGDHLDSVDLTFIYFPSSRLAPPSESPRYSFAASELE